MKTSIKPRTFARDQEDKPWRTAELYAAESSCIVGVCNHADVIPGSDPSMIVDLSWWSGPGHVRCDPTRVVIPAHYLGDTAPRHITAKQCADVVRLLRAAVVSGLEIPEDLRAALALIG